MPAVIVSEPAPAPRSALAGMPERGRCRRVAGGEENMPSFCALWVSGRRRIVGAAAALVAVLLPASLSQAQEPPVQASSIPVADAFVFAGEPNSNYGGAG